MKVAAFNGRPRKDGNTVCLIKPHTNDYLTEEFLRFNETKGPRTRYERIKELLIKHDGIFAMDNFPAMSADQHDGPPNSLWRTGKTTTGTRTLVGLDGRFIEGQALSSG